MKRLINDNWQFALLPLDSDLDAALALPEAAWQDVDIPHDWLIENADDLYADGDGWYRRTIEAPEDCAGSAWLLRFDGVYMDCRVWLNGELLAEHRYGYTAFDADLTRAIRPGENLLTVRVRHRAPNSRWYSGAGIFRDVTLSALPPRHIAPDGLYVRTLPDEGGAWTVRVDAEPVGPGLGGEAVFALWDGDALIAWERVFDGGEGLSAALRVPAPRLWSCDTPNLYRLTVDFNGESDALRVGLRETRFDPDGGFFLNGNHVKLHGVCLHHDLGAIGAAFNAAAFRRQMRLMKRMGVNALRTSHNPPAARALDICDEEGVLVVDEAFDMWLMPKTRYDYARFFPDHWREDVRAWVRRDRNHPCVVMWSVGNEIPDTHVSPDAPKLTAELMDEVTRHDPERNARPTIGSNYMPWEGAQKCADVLKLAGYNYAERYYAAHHAAHPDWVIYGSETASILSSRGVYHFPASANAISEEDLQCSSLGNSTTSWGARDMRHCIVDDLNTPYSMGQFLWSGTDYIGEPTPYRTRSCYFGMADTAGFPKDLYYQVKALWNPEPMAHIGVGWDWNPGQMIDVPVYANGARVELFKDGESLGGRTLDLRDPDKCMAWWRLPYAPGTLTAVCYDAAGREIARDEVCSHGDSARLTVTAEASALRADGEDMAFVEIAAVDAQGRPVGNAADWVRVRVEGPARLLGLDNGDSTDETGYRVCARRLFNGKLLAMVGATDEPGTARVIAEADGLEGAAVALEFRPAEGRPGHSGRQGVSQVSGEARPVHARKIELSRLDVGGALTPEHPEVRFSARLLPAGAGDQEIEYRIVNALGIVSPIAQARAVPGGVLVTGQGDGEAWLRATVNNGAAHARVLSQLELRLEGFGATSLDPYGFVTGGLYDIHEGLITSGNDKGIAFDRDGVSMAGFTHVDFGPVGSDEITLPIFELDSQPLEIELWMGDPREDGHRVDTLHYDKKSIWNTYQSETWRLPERFVGMQTVAFRLSRKAHLKGFSFARLNRAWLRCAAGEADDVNGDSFTPDGGAVRGIGNNVTLRFDHMDFGPGGPARLVVCGATPLAENPVQARFTDGTVFSLPFAGDGPREQGFDLEIPGGADGVSFVFLPGSNFDFEWFRFEKREAK